MKKYIAFDCESIHIRHKYPCSFGYIKTNENLNSLEQEDIIINPKISQTEYDYRVIKKICPYSLKEILQSPTFTQQYPKIKKILTTPNALIIGFQINEDIKYILNDCIRNNLEPINFSFVDLRNIIYLLEKRKSKSLREEYMFWLHRLPQNAHNSMSDASMTIEVLNAILAHHRIDLQSLINAHHDLLGKVENFVITYKSNSIDIRLPKTKTKHRNRIKPNKSGQENYIVKGSENFCLFTHFLNTVTRQNDANNIFNNQKISISLNYEHYNFKNMLKLVQLITNAGGTYVKKASTADIFVTYNPLDENHSAKCTKMEYVIESNKNGTNIEIIDFETLLSKLNITENQLNTMPDIEVEIQG